MISKKEVCHIADLARLELTEKEIRKMQKDLAKILEYFNLLKEVKFKEKKEERNQKEIFLKKEELKDFQKIFREDIIERKDIDLINKLFESCPEKEKGYVKVKAVF